MEYYVRVQTAKWRKRMAYKDEKEVLFVRIPMSTEEKKTIDKAVNKTNSKKYEWFRRTLLSAAKTELAKEAE